MSDQAMRFSFSTLSLVLILALGFVTRSHAQTEVPGTILNEVLFELNGEVWTSYDYKQFVKAKSKVQLNPDFVKLAANDLDLFLMTRLLLRQITDSMSSTELVKYNIVSKYKDMNESLAAEIHRLNTIIESEDSRYKQLVSKDKYDMWMNYMKKKYSFSAQ